MTDDQNKEDGPTEEPESRLLKMVQAAAMMSHEPIALQLRFLQTMSLNRDQCFTIASSGGINTTAMGGQTPKQPWSGSDRVPFHQKPTFETPVGLKL